MFYRTVRREYLLMHIKHSCHIDRLFVEEAYVGQSFVLKRFHARAKGRGAGIKKPFSHLTIIVREKEV
jgi:large subunit ribosomal protein L22